MIAWEAQSLLPSYPDSSLVARLPLLRQVATAVPSPVGAPLHRFLDHRSREEGSPRRGWERVR